MSRNNLPLNNSHSLFKDVFSGEKTVRFSEPVSNLTVENGSVVFAHVNYAVISSGGGAVCTLRGRPYINSQSAVTVKNPDIIEGTREKIEKIDNCTLIHRGNSQITAQRLYNYYLRKRIFDGDFILNPEIIINNNINNNNFENYNFEKIGDTVKIAAGFSDYNNNLAETESATEPEAGGYITGQIERLTLNLGAKKIKARGIIRGE